MESEQPPIIEPPIVDIEPVIVEQPVFVVVGEPQPTISVEVTVEHVEIKMEVPVVEESQVEESVPVEESEEVQEVSQPVVVDEG